MILPTSKHQLFLELSSTTHRTYTKRPNIYKRNHTQWWYVLEGEEVHIPTSDSISLWIEDGIEQGVIKAGSKNHLGTRYFYLGPVIYDEDEWH